MFLTNTSLVLLSVECLEPSGAGIAKTVLNEMRCNRVGAKKNHVFGIYYLYYFVISNLFLQRN